VRQQRPLLWVARDRGDRGHPSLLLITNATIMPIRIMTALLASSHHINMNQRKGSSTMIMRSLRSSYFCPLLSFHDSCARRVCRDSPFKHN
jgi:hypothetical protein